MSLYKCDIAPLHTYFLLPSSLQVQEQTEKELFNERLAVKARLDAERRQFGDLYAAEVNAVGGDDLPRVTMELDRYPLHIPNIL